MKRWKAEQRELQRRKLVSERKLTDKQLDALAAVAYGELDREFGKHILRGQVTTKVIWSLDSICVNGRLKTLRGYRLVVRRLDSMGLAFYALTGDGAHYLRLKGIL